MAIFKDAIERLRPYFLFRVEQGVMKRAREKQHKFSCYLRNWHESEYKSDTWVLIAFQGLNKEKIYNWYRPSKIYSENPMRKISQRQNSSVRVILSLNRFIRGRTTTNYDVNSLEWSVFTHCFAKTTTYYAPHIP